MPSDTRPLKVDANNKPIPQYFDTLADDYAPLEKPLSEATYDATDGAPTDAAAPIGGEGSHSAKLRRITQELEDIRLALTSGGGSTSLGSSSNTIGKVQVRNAADNADIDALSEATFAAVQGTAADAAVAAGATGSLSAKLRAISRDLVANIVLAAGANRIGKVTIRDSANAADIDPLSGTTYSAAAGASTDAASGSGNGTIIGHLRQVRDHLNTLLGRLPAALTGSGNLKVAINEVVASMTVDTEMTAAEALGNNSNPTTALVGACEMVWNPTDAQWQRRRTPTIWKPINLSAISTEVTVWTPASGKKFRLLGFLLFTSAAQVLTLNDNTAGTAILNAEPGTGANLGFVLPGNGYLSAAANNVLSIARGGNTTVVGVVFGTEE